MNAVGSISPEFFRILHPEFLKKLRLPFAFITKYGLKPGMATIRTKLGVWSVNLEGEGDGSSSMLFGAGWAEFSKDHNLHVGYFIIFKYKDNMVFNAKIFNKTCCRVECANKQQNNVDKKETKGQGSSKASRSSNREAKGKKLILQDPERAFDQESKDARSDDVQEQQAANAVIIPKFEKIMTMDRRLVIPFKFCTYTGLLNVSEITIKDEKNREWKVDLWITRLKCRLGRGFRKFVEVNGIKVGDKCIFRLVSETTLQVQIIRARQPLPIVKRRKLNCNSSR